MRKVERGLKEVRRGASKLMQQGEITGRLYRMLSPESGVAR